MEVIRVGSATREREFSSTLRFKLMREEDENGSRNDFRIKPKLYLFRTKETDVDAGDEDQDCHADGTRGMQR